jgi:alkylation response protein AidB-like acyl-CoA dehydrogenase
MSGIRDTDEQAMLRESIAKLARSFGHEYYAAKARENGRTTELWQAVGEQGYLGVNLPEEYGGGGMGISELAIVCEELAAAGCPLLLIVVSPAIGGVVLSRFGTDEQKRRWVPGIASGELLFAFAITEPDAGSNSHKISTTATRDGDGWRIRGTKYYISGVDEADEILVVARTGVDEASGRGKLSLFVVPPDSEGLTKTVIPVGIHAPERQYSLFFDDVYVDGDRLVGAEGDGLRQVFAGLNPERITGGAQACGLGRYALGRGTEYAKTRSVWGQPIGAHQGLAHPMAEAKIHLELARLGIRHAAALYDAGLDAEAGEAANMAKFAAAEAAIECLDTSIQAHGGNGLALEYGLIDMYGFTRLQRIAPVSREMVLNYVATHSLGLPKGY